MAKRLIVPTKATLVVSDGVGTLSVPSFSGAFTYIAIEGPLSSAKGRIRVRDVDEDQDISRDPRKATQTIDLEFYNQAVRIPINGPSQIILDGATNGSYTIYYVQEERPQRV